MFDAYERKHRLIAVVPFVAKILDSCTRSKIFTSSNVWVNAYLRLLAEIYHEPDLKLNLTFEIEVLCNNLGLDIHGARYLSRFSLSLSSLHCGVGCAKLIDTVCFWLLGTR